MTSAIDPTREPVSGIVQNENAERKVASLFSRLPPEVIERYGTDSPSAVVAKTSDYPVQERLYFCQPVRSLWFFI